jgi:glycosyltransferase involved in cell wall biosynthesis
MSGRQPLVSVVTPVYNGEAYIRECIESVVAQTYEKWEYTIVDNASEDATPEIAAEYAARDSRIRHLRFEELVGINDNHNRAFRAIADRSEYCKVVQADDWLYPECLERMVEVAERSDRVGVVSAYRLWGTVVDLVGVPYTESILDGTTILAQSLTGGPYVTGAPTALMYRSSVVRDRDPFFSDDFEHADTEAAYAVMTQWDVGFVHQLLTFARRQPGARTDWAGDVSTYLPENIRFLRRYGPEALEPEVYRRRLRKELKRYVRFHVRQSAKPSRLTDRRFFDVHRDEIAAIRAEGGRDAEVEAALLLVRTLLLRGGRRRRQAPELQTSQWI